MIPDGDVGIAKLTVEIKNTKPIELLDLSDSFQSLGRQYVRYLTKHNVKVNNDTRLYVNQLRTGSVIADLVDRVPFSVLFADAENFNNIIDFAKNIGLIYNYFLGSKIYPKEDLKEADIKNYSNILNPIVKDSGSQLNITGSFNNSPIVVYNLNSLEANAAQNTMRLELENTKTTIAGLHEKVVFYWHTLRNAQNNSTGEKGVIETISSVPVKVIFGEDTIKNEMAFMKDVNPMLIGYIVDVQVETVQEKPVLYKILKFHDVIV